MPDTPEYPKGSLDDLPDDDDLGSPPWLCDECVEKGRRGPGVVALVQECPQCKHMKCPHCFPEGSTICERCVAGIPPDVILEDPPA